MVFVGNLTGGLRGAGLFQGLRWVSKTISGCDTAGKPKKRGVEATIRTATVNIPLTGRNIGGGEEIEGKTT